MRFSLLKLLIGAKCRGRPLTGPLSVQVSISDACNYRCLMCWDHPPAQRRVPGLQQSSKAMMDPDLFRKIVNDLADLGCRKLRFIGRGEPTLNPHFLEMVALAESRGLICDLTSNGSRLTPEMAEQLAAGRLKTLEVSLNAATGQTHRRICGPGPPHDWDNILRALESFSQYRRSNQLPSGLRLSFVISSVNVKDIAALAEVARQVGAQELRFDLVQVHSKSKDLLLSEADLKEAQIQEVELSKRCAKYNIGHNLGFVLEALAKEKAAGTTWARLIYKQIPCHVGYYFSLILADGTVIGCCSCQRSLGNVAERGFVDIWRSQAYNEYRQECVDLPRRRTVVRGCTCYDCGMARHNASLWRVLHPLKRCPALSGTRLFGLADVKRRFG